MEHGKALEATLRTSSGSAVTHSSPKVCHRRGVFVQQKKGGWVARMTLLPYLSVTTRCASTAPEATKMLNVLQRAKMLAPHHERCEAKDVYQALSDACAEHSNFSRTFSSNKSMVNHCTSLVKDDLTVVENMGKVGKGSWYMYMYVYDSSIQYKICLIFIYIHNIYIYTWLYFSNKR